MIIASWSMLQHGEIDDNGFWIWKQLGVEHRLATSKWKIRTTDRSWCTCNGWRHQKILAGRLADVGKLNGCRAPTLLPRGTTRDVFVTSNDNERFNRCWIYQIHEISFHSLLTMKFSSVAVSALVVASASFAGAFAPSKAFVRNVGSSSAGVMAPTSTALSMA